MPGTVFSSALVIGECYETGQWKDLWTGCLVCDKNSVIDINSSELQYRPKKPREMAEQKETETRWHWGSPHQGCWLRREARAVPPGCGFGWGNLPPPACLIHNEGRNNFAAHFALALHANFITVCNSLCNPQRKGIITKKKMIITKHIVFIYNLHFRIHYSWCQYFIMEEWDMLSFCLMEVNSDLILPRSWIFNRAEQSSL